MAEMNFNTRERGGNRKYRPRRLQTRVDMTPMVDLGFLLITFFILTTTLIKMNTLAITVPSKGGESNIPGSTAVTILMDKDNNLYYYLGGKTNDMDPVIHKTNYSPAGIRQILLERNVEANNQIRALKTRYETGTLKEKEYLELVDKARGARFAPYVIIKATDDATYNNVVNILDEMKICNIGKYALVDITPYDLDLIKKQKFM